MATRTITTKLALDGEAEYRAKVKNINAELALHKSELEKVQAQYKTSANSLEALSAKQSALKGQLEALNKRHEAQAEMLKKAQEAQTKFSAQAEKLRDKLEALRSSSAATAEEEEKLQKELAQAEANMQKAGNSATFYQKQLNSTERDQAKLGTELKKTTGYLNEAESDFYKCAKSIDEYGNEVKDAGEDSKEFGDASKEAVNQLAGALAAAGVAKTVEEIAAALMECVDAFGEFESQMSTVEAISGASSAQMGELTEKAKEMGATTSFTATEAGQALEYMAMAGWKTNDMLGGLEGIMNLAAASGESLGATSDIVTDALTAFGLAASDSAHFADVLAAASSNSNTNVGMMGETFKYAAPVAGALGYSIEDTALAIGLMANAGIKGSQAGTALRGTLTNLAKPSESAAIYMEKLGISLTDNEGNVKSLSELIGTLRERFSELTEAEKAEYAAGIAGKEAMSGLLAIVNASEADYQKLAHAIDTCNGSAQRMAETKLDNYAGQVKLLESAIDGLKLEIGSQLAPVLTDLAGGATTVVGGLTKLLEVCPAIVPILAGLVTAGKALVVAFAGFAIIKTITPMVTAFNAALAANPMGMVAVAVIGVVTALGTLAARLKDTDQQTKTFTGSLKDSKTAYDDLTASMAEQKMSNRAMASSLRELLSVEQKSALQKDLIQQKVERLNEAVPELNLAYDREKDALVGVTEAELNSMLAREEAQAQYEAQVARLEELTTERTEIASRLMEARLALNEAEETGVGNTLELQNAIKELTAAQEENEQQTAALEEASRAYGEEQAQAAAKSREMEQRIQDLNAQMAELDEAHQKNMEAARANLERQMGLFEDLKKSADISINDMIESLNKQEEATNSYAENIQKAMERGVDDGLIQKLSDGREESARILDAIVNGTDEEIDNLNDAFGRVEEGKTAFGQVIDELENDYSNKMDEIVRKMNESMAELNQAEEAWKVGQDNIQGLINGATSKMGALTATYVKAAKDALNAYAREMDQHSPSKKLYKMGRFDIEGLILGVKSEESKLAAAYREVAQTALYNMEHHLPARIMEPRASAAQERQAQAIAAAFQTQNGETRGFTIHIDRVEVRNDQDVDRIARKLYQLTQQEYRGRGGGSL